LVYWVENAEKGIRREEKTERLFAVVLGERGLNRLYTAKRIGSPSPCQSRDKKMLIECLFKQKGRQG